MKSSFPEERIDGVRAGVRCRGTQPSDGKMRKPVSKPRRDVLHRLALAFRQVAQLGRQRALELMRGDLLEGVTQGGQPRSDGARGHLLAQAREALIDGGAYGSQAQQLGHTLLLYLSHEVTHADADDSSAARFLGIDVGRYAEVDGERRA